MRRKKSYNKAKKQQEKDCFKVQAGVSTCAPVTHRGQSITIILLLFYLQNPDIDNFNSRTGFLQTSYVFRKKKKSYEAFEN